MKDSEYFDLCLKRAKTGLEWLLTFFKAQDSLQIVQMSRYRLDMSSDTDCVLALFTSSSYEAACNTLCLNLEKSIDRGFIIGKDYSDLEPYPTQYKIDRAYTMLTDAWKYIIDPERLMLHETPSDHSHA